MTAPANETEAFLILTEGARLLGLSLQDEQIARMVTHLQMLVRWQERVNLTSIQGIHDLATLHFLDSLTVFKVITIGEQCRVLDIGTGAGFPGVVMKLVDESMGLTLLDRDPKKIVFLKNLCRELRLEAVKFLNFTLEILLDDPPGDPFDLVISRALLSDSTRLDSLQPLVARGGSLIRMAGPSLRETDMILGNFRESASWEGELPGTRILRRVIRYARI
jgi:16S rRNA (guanine527-N7)-methyltransferase